MIIDVKSLKVMNLGLEDPTHCSGRLPVKKTKQNNKTNIIP
jgi:hypothetical protein